MLPESLLAWILSTLGQGFLHGLGFSKENQLENLVAHAGIKGTFKLLKDRVRAFDILEGQPSKNIRVGNLKKIDRNVLNSISASRFYDFCLETWGTSHGCSRLAPETIRVLFGFRDYLAYTYDVTRFLRKLQATCSCGDAESTLETVVLHQTKESLSKEDHQEIRRLLMDCEAGPPTSILCEAVKPTLELNR